MSLLVADGVTVARDGRAILDAVSATVEAGMFVALAGANGAGKSTLLSCLAGLLHPDEGTVRLDGVPLTQIKRRTLARRRAYLPQGPRAEWPISVERLVALGLTPQLPSFGGLDHEVEPRLTRTLAAFDLERRRFQAATTLSGGELSRAMLARALVGEPQVLLADEPTTGLDPRHAMDTAARLRRLADSGVLVVASLHDLTLAARHATHMMVLKTGRLTAFGPVQKVLTSATLRDAFGVEACVIGTGPSAFVDYLAPSV